MIDLWCSKMVRTKLRLALTVLIILAVCTGLVISTAEAKSGSTSGKSASSTGKGTTMGTTGFNTAATGRVSVSATPAFGSTVSNNANAASDNVFGTASNLAQATRTGSFLNSFGQSFSPGVTAFGNPMAAATNTFGSSVFGNAVAQADNVFGTTNSMVDATRQGSFINSFGQSFTPGVTATGQVQAAASPLFGSSVFGSAVTAADNVFGSTSSMVDANRQGSFINSFGQSFVPGVTNFGQVQVAADRSGSFITSDAQSII
jgi:hypothetical protein